MVMMATNLWFDNQAEEAVDFYLSVFEIGKKNTVLRYPDEGQEIHGQTAGTILTIDFELAGRKFVALNGGPVFTPNPSISFILNFDPSKDENASETIERYWEKLTDGGTVLMAFQEYPFSKKYGWVQDKFGISWQLMLTDPAGEERPFITPSLMFIGENNNKAEEAIRFYTSVFKDPRIGTIARYSDDTGPANKGSLMFADFMIESAWFAAMDSGVQHEFNFNEAVSLIVYCETQEEIDYYWKELSAVPEAEQCGWLKDKYGVSWQIVPTAIFDLYTGDEARYKRAFAAMMQMKKLNIAQLEAAAAG